MTCTAPRIAFVVALAAAPASAQPSFVDVAGDIGIVNVSFGRGAAVVDLDGDGREDLIGTNAGMTSAFWRHMPDDTFQRTNDAWGVPEMDDRAWAVIASDFDGDGDADVFFPTGGFGLPQANRLLRNDLDDADTFTDVTAAAGDVDVPTASFSGSGLDYDRDGDLDVFLAGRTDENSLLRNDGGLVFTDVSVAANVADWAYHHHCGAGDYDNDGYPDIGVGRMIGSSALYHNEGDGTFLDVAVAAGLGTQGANFGMVFEDFDNDGWLDVFIPKYLPGVSGILRLYMNEQDGTFRDVSLEVGPELQLDMGHITGDVDLDGYPDIFIGTGNPDYLADDVLYTVVPDGRGGLDVTDVSASSGILASGPSRAHGTALFDYDQDGDVDMYVNNGGPDTKPETIQADFFWENQGNGNHWVEVGLRGVLSNRTAVGARARVTTVTGREVWSNWSAGKGFGNTPSPRHMIGLGTDDGADLVEIVWPSGITQTVLGPLLDQRLTVTETGLRVLGTPAIGSEVVIELCGPPNTLSELFAGIEPVEVPKPGFGGILEVFPFLVGPIPLPLGPEGQLALDVAIDNDPLLVGLTLIAQTWVHPPGLSTPTILSDAVEITIE